jgi:pimeloyl-ACP methyl ester carboxylesterase
MVGMSIDVPTPDGRTLEVLDAGPGDGVPLVFHHGTPQGAIPFPPLERPAAERGIRVISYSRPGYGGSTPRPEGTVADDARDTATILDHLGVGEFMTMGWSGGGPRALACAAVLPDRCRAAACCVGLVPASEFDGDIRDGMAEENVAEFTAAMAGREELSRFLDTQAGYFAVTGDEIAAALGGLAPPVDRAALTGELADLMAESMRAAGRQGTVGWLDDDLTMLRDWGFRVADITVPVAVWQGTEDAMVPFRHAEWLAAHVSGCRANLVEGEGHLSLLARIGDILDELLALAGRARG